MHIDPEYRRLLRDLIGLRKAYRELAEQFPDANPESLQILLAAETKWEATIARRQRKTGPRCEHNSQHSTVQSDDAVG